MSVVLSFGSEFTGLIVWIDEIQNCICGIFIHARQSHKQIATDASATTGC